MRETSVVPDRPGPTIKIGGLMATSSARNRWRARPVGVVEGGKRTRQTGPQRVIAGRQDSGVSGNEHDDVGKLLVGAASPSSRISAEGDLAAQGAQHQSEIARGQYPAIGRKRSWIEGAVEKRLEDEHNCGSRYKQEAEVAQLRGPKHCWLQVNGRSNDNHQNFNQQQKSDCIPRLEYFVDGCPTPGLQPTVKTLRAKMSRASSATPLGR